MRISPQPAAMLAGLDRSARCCRLTAVFFVGIRDWRHVGKRAGQRFQPVPRAEKLTRYPGLASARTTDGETFFGLRRKSNRLQERSGRAFSLLFRFVTCSQSIRRANLRCGKLDGDMLIKNSYTAPFERRRRSRSNYLGRIRTELKITVRNVGAAFEPCVGCRPRRWSPSKLPEK
jgi:hypothetical protein